VIWGAVTFCSLFGVAVASDTDDPPIDIPVLQEVRNLSKLPQDVAMGSDSAANRCTRSLRARGPKYSASFTSANCDMPSWHCKSHRHGRIEVV
jgi:hypothetical protein